MTLKAKPCPFCGKKAMTWKESPVRTAQVWCPHPSCGVHVQSHASSIDKAIAAWNKRAEARK